MQMKSTHAAGKITAFDWADPFGLDEQLTDEERMVRDTAEGYAQEKLLPRVVSAYATGTVPAKTPKKRSVPAGSSCSSPTAPSI